MAHASAVAQPPAGPLSGGERLISLDAFRGAIVALMILVNSAGSFPEAYAPLQHVEWNGWTITDVVFPSFVWIVGLSLTFSLRKRKALGIPRIQLLLQILRRGAILYALGLFLYAFPEFNLATARILGVLQRIAICYVAASVIYLYFDIRGQVAFIIGLLASYWLLMTYAPVPGFGAGRLDVEGNFAHYVDRILLGAHNYSHTKTWDPEGVISTLPAVASALFGVMASHILRLRRELTERTTWLFLIGNVLLVLGLIFDIWMPVNKKLWTDSFVLLMSGLDFSLFAGALWLIDGVGYNRWSTPFVILGMNTITVYMLSELGETMVNVLHVGGTTLRMWIYNTLFATWLTPKNASLVYSLLYVGILLLIAYSMYRRRVFIRV